MICWFGGVLVATIQSGLYVTRRLLNRFIHAATRGLLSSMLRSPLDLGQYCLYF